MNLQLGITLSIKEAMALRTSLNTVMYDINIAKHLTRSELNYFRKLCEELDSFLYSFPLNNKKLIEFDIDGNT